MALSRVWVDRISKTRGVLKTSECPKSIASFRFPEFITGFVTIFDMVSVTISLGHTPVRFTSLVLLNFQVGKWESRYPQEQLRTG